MAWKWEHLELRVLWGNKDGFSFISGSYSVSCNSQPINTNQLATISSTNQLNNLGNNKSCNNVKVSLVIPGVITGNSSNSSCSSSSSSSSSLCSINSVTNIKPSVSTPLLMPPITLSAVTPSTLKTQSFSQVSLEGWLFEFCGVAWVSLSEIERKDREFLIGYVWCGIKTGSCLN